MPTIAAPTYQAIRTVYLCPTNYRGSRYKATCQALSVTISADDALSLEDNHRAACEALCARMGARMGAKGGATWLRPTVGGVLPDGSFAWVFLPTQG